jgi:hypothetical protein
VVVHLGPPWDHVLGHVNSECGLRQDGDDLVGLEGGGYQGLGGKAARQQQQQQCLYGEDRGPQGHSALARGPAGEGYACSGMHASGQVTLAMQQLLKVAVVVLPCLLLA